MEDFHNGRHRCAALMTSPPWESWNILPEQRGLLCGTGWRASEGFMYARAMGWKNISVYDGGCTMEQPPANPVSSGERGPDSSR